MNSDSYVSEINFYVDDTDHFALQAASRREIYRSAKMLNFFDCTQRFLLLTDLHGCVWTSDEESRVSCKYLLQQSL